jgi:hypothetical protein
LIAALWLACKCQWSLWSIIMSPCKAPCRNDHPMADAS